MTNNSTTLKYLQGEVADWGCQLPVNLTIASCGLINNTANATCQHWIYDKSIFTRTVVSDVSHCFIIHHDFVIILSINFILNQFFLLV